MTQECHCMMVSPYTCIHFDIIVVVSDSAGHSLSVLTGRLHSSLLCQFVVHIIQFERNTIASKLHMAPLKNMVSNLNDCVKVHQI